MHELKQKKDIHKNYKTKQCKRFHKERFCPYGTRCQFLHDELFTESDNSVILAVKQVKVAKSKPKNKKSLRTVASAEEHQLFAEELDNVSVGSDEEATRVF